jgi:L-threonylcarbamoyladenylate synthase
MTATAGLGTVGVRIPESRVALALIAAADCPIAAPSANLSNRISPTTAQHVQQDLGSQIPMILDAGPCSAGVESTVIDLSGDVPAVLRPGPITTEMLSIVLGQQITVRTPKSAPDQNEMMNSPGQLTVHYAPRKPLRFWRNSFPDSLDWDDSQVASLLIGQDNSEFQKILSQPLKGRSIRISSARESEHRLYQILHELDLDPGVREIRVCVFIDTSNLSEWAAVLDRLTRAAANFQ